MRIIAVSLLFLSLVYSQPSAQENWSAEQREVLTAINSYLSAWNAQDAEALADYCAADCDRIDARGNVYVGREAIREHYSNLFRRPAPIGYPSRLSYEVRSIRLIGLTTAIVDANYSLENPPPCPGGTIEGMNTVVLTKENGRWLRRAHRQRVPDQLSLSSACQDVIRNETRGPDNITEDNAVESALDVQRRMTAALLTGNTDEFLGYLSVDFVATDPGNNTRRWQDMADVLSTGRLQYDSVDTNVDFAEQLDDRLVVVTGTESTRQSAVPVDGELEQRALDAELVRRFTNVFRKEGAAWRLLIKQSTIIADDVDR